MVPLANIVSVPSLCLHLLSNRCHVVLKLRESSMVPLANIVSVPSLCLHLPPHRCHVVLKLRESSMVPLVILCQCFLCVYICHRILREGSIVPLANIVSVLPLCLHLPPHRCHVVLKLRESSMVPLANIVSVLLCVCICHRSDVMLS